MLHIALTVECWTDLIGFSKWDKDAGCSAVSEWRGAAPGRDFIRGRLFLMSHPEVEFNHVVHADVVF